MGIRWGIDDLGLDIVMTCTGIEFFGLRIDDFNGDRHFRACPFRIFTGASTAGFVKGSDFSGWILQDLWRDRIVRDESFRICEGIELFGLNPSGFVKGSNFSGCVLQDLWRDRSFWVVFFRICEGIGLFGLSSSGFVKGSKFLVVTLRVCGIGIGTFLWRDWRNGGLELILEEGYLWRDWRNEGLERIRVGIGTEDWDRSKMGLHEYRSLYRSPIIIIIRTLHLWYLNFWRGEGAINK